MGLGALAALVAIAAGCAPHVVRVSELVPAVRETRYRDLLAARESRAAAEAQITLWARGSDRARLASADGRLLLASPDAIRLRLGSVIGTALDLAARGDSITAYVPPRRQALRLDAQRDTLGLPRPGGFAWRAMSGAWRPPDEAWSGATWNDTLLTVRWLERDDSLAIAVGSDGLPAWAELTRAGGGGVRVRYRGWDRGAQTPWPNVIEIADLRGSLSLTVRVTQVRFTDRPDPGRLAVPIPADAASLTLASLRRALVRLGVM
jgi:hypothetical protein